MLQYDSNTNFDNDNIPTLSQYEVIDVPNEAEIRMWIRKGDKCVCVYIGPITNFGNKSSAHASNFFYNGFR